MRVPDRKESACSPPAAEPPKSPAQRLAQLRPSLRCPACHCGLGDEPQALRCVGCNTRFPLLLGRPVLMTEQSRRELDLHLETADGRRMVQEYADPIPVIDQNVAPWWLRLLRPPPIMYRYQSDLKQPPTSVLFEDTDAGSPLTLNVGGGPYRVSEAEITLNIRPFHNVDVVADAHNIPVDDNTFDSVFSLAVLEHVADPYHVVAEMIRVLKPGGYLYSEVPFIFFFHGYPTDYTRFTREGMKRLFAGLEDAQFEMTHGPVSAVLQSINMVLQILLPARPKALRKLVNGAFRWMFFPLKYLDIPLRRHSDAHILAGGFYVLGRKPRGR